MSTQSLESGQLAPDPAFTAKFWLRVSAASYGLYALFLLIEVLDFLSILHSKPPEEHATYTIVHVAYFIVEMIVCVTMALVFWIMKPTGRNGAVLGLACLLIALGRLGLVYYLYLYTDPDWHWTPFVYKVANDFSEPMRVVFLPAQVIIGLIAAWCCGRSRKG